MAIKVIGRGDDGSYASMAIADAGAVVAGAGLQLVGGTLSLPATVAGRGISLTAGVLDIAEGGEGVPTAITTVGAGTLTAAALMSGLIMRSGPVGAYNDTTDTATAILALWDSPAVGSSVDFTIVNGVAFALTMVAGAGITLAGVTAIAASAVRKYRMHITNVGTPAITITGIGAMTA